MGLLANKTPFLTLKHTPKNCAKSHHTTDKTCWVIKRWLLNKVKLTWEPGKLCPIARNDKLPPFFYFTRSFSDHCPISSWNSKTLFECTCMWRLSENGRFVTFCTYGYFLVSKKLSNVLISRI